MPSAALEASQQLESINISSTLQDSVMVLTVPRGIENGAAGAATSLINYNYPVVRGVIGDAEPGYTNMAAEITSTNVNAGNFNIFNILGSNQAGGEATTIKVLF
jgi:spore coat protein CotF